MSGLLKEKQRTALWEVVAMGQYNGIVRPSRWERKAAKAAFRVLDEHGAVPDEKERREMAAATAQRLAS